MRALLAPVGPVPRELIAVAVAVAERTSDIDLAVAVLRRPEVTAAQAALVAQPVRHNGRVRAALLARPETPVPVAVESARTARDATLRRALAAEPAARPELLEELAGLGGAAFHVLDRADAPVAARARALRTLEATLWTSTGNRNRAKIAEDVQRALQRAPMPAAALGAVVADVRHPALLGAVAGSELPAKAQRRVAEACVDEQLREIGVRASESAAGYRSWVARVTLALARREGCVVRAKLTRSWDRRGPRRGTQLDALPQRLQEQLRVAMWSPTRRLDALPLADAARAAVTDEPLARAFLDRLSAGCGTDPSRWNTAVRLAGQTHGSLGDLEVALRAVIG